MSSTQLIRSFTRILNINIMIIIGCKLAHSVWCDCFGSTKNKAFNPLTKALTTYFECNLKCSLSYLLISVRRTTTIDVLRAKKQDGANNRIDKEWFRCKLHHIMQITRVIAIKLKRRERNGMKRKEKKKRKKYEIHNRNIVRGGKKCTRTMKATKKECKKGIHEEKKRARRNTHKNKNEKWGEWTSATLMETHSLHQNQEYIYIQIIP